MIANTHFFPQFRPLLPRLPLRYMIAEQHDVVRQGIVALLNDVPDLECAGQVSYGKDFMDAICANKPDILLTGLLLEGGASPLAVLRQCSQCLPEMGLIVLSLCNHSLAVAESARAGAHGFVSKDESFERLLEVIFRVATGERRVFPPAIDPYDVELTERERMVICYIASGLTTEEIGRKICVSSKTVEAHRTQLLRRFGLRKSIDLVRLAFASGIALNEETVVLPLCPRACECKRYLAQHEK